MSLDKEEHGEVSAEPFWTLSVQVFPNAFALHSL